MLEIDLRYLEENFDEIMSQVERGQSYLLRTPDGAGIIIHAEKNPIIDAMKEQKLIKKYE